MSDFQCFLTPIGRTKQTTFLTGGPPISVTHMAVGDGGGVPVTFNEDSTDLVNEVRRSSVSRVYTSGLNAIAEQIILPTVGGFWVREVSMIDVDGDVIAVGNTPETFKPSPASGASRLLTLSMSVAVANSGVVQEVILDPTTTLASRAYVDDFKDDIETAVDEINISIGEIQSTIADLPGVWPDAEKLGGQPPSYYATATSVAAAVVTGAQIDYWGSAAPTGWVLASGRTIGNASSGATERANVDTEALFTLLWNSIGQTELPIQTSAGGASTRGASAAADFAADKRLPLPDMRGRVSAGKDDMGGSAANRMTFGGSGVAGATPGASGGTETHTLTSAQVPNHTHTASTDSAGAHAHTANINTGGNQFSGSVFAAANDGTNSYSGVTTSSAGAHSHAVSVNPTTGGGGAHNNTQPTMVINKIIKL